MAYNKKILRFIEAAAQQGGTQFNLSNKQLTSLPPEIGKLTSVTHLNLGHNQLNKLAAGDRKTEQVDPPRPQL